MATCHLGIFAKHAAVPGAQLQSNFSTDFIVDIEAVTGWTDIGTGTAVQAFKLIAVPDKDLQTYLLIFPAVQTNQI